LRIACDTLTQQLYLHVIVNVIIHCCYRDLVTSFILSVTLSVIAYSCYTVINYNNHKSLAFIIAKLNKYIWATICISHYLDHIVSASVGKCNLVFLLLYIYVLCLWCGFWISISTEECIFRYGINVHNETMGSSLQSLSVPTLQTTFC